MKKPSFLSNPYESLRRKLLQDHMFGSFESKIKAYENPYFPEEMIEGLILSLIDQNSQQKSHQEVKENSSLIQALVRNPNFPADIFLEKINQGNFKFSSIIEDIKTHTSSSEVKNLVQKELEKSMEILKTLWFQNNSSLYEELISVGMISGGAIRHYFNKVKERKGFLSESRDVDIFLKKTDFFENSLKYFLAEFKVEEKFEVIPTSLGVRINTQEIKDFKQSSREGNYYIQKSLVLTENAITLNYMKKKKNHDHGYEEIESYSYQIISKVIRNSSEEITNTFDFAHCQGFYELKDKTLFIPKDCLQSIHQNRLIFKGGISPLGAFRRMNKFCSQNMTINSAELLKMATYIKTFDLSNAEVLKDLLKGYYEKKIQYPELNLIEGVLVDEEISHLLNYLGNKNVRGN